MFQAAMLQVPVAYILQNEILTLDSLSSFQAMAGTGMPGMGAASGQPAAAPLAQAESAADFTEQVSCHNTVDLTSSAGALTYLNCLMLCHKRWQE